MLFLPIDKSLLNQKNQHAKTNSVVNRSKPRRHILTKPKSIERAQTTSFSQARNARQKPHYMAIDDIASGTEKANSLIDYMRSVQNAHNATFDNRKGSGTLLSSKNRIMTTMKPSIKEKLRRNLNTFSRDDSDQDREKSGVRLNSVGSPDSIMKLPLPSYTKNAYQDANIGGMSSTISQTQSPLPNHEHQMQQQQENLFAVAPPSAICSKDINDEVILFKVNAAKPLVNLQRKINMDAARQQNKIGQSQRPSVFYQRREYASPIKQQQQSTSTVQLAPKASSFKKYRHSQPIQHDDPLQKRKRVTKQPGSSLYYTQMQTSNILSQGKSRHLSSGRNSNEDCKSSNLTITKEDSMDAVKLNRTIHNKTEVPSATNVCLHSHNQTPYSQKDTAASQPPPTEDPFTVKLCVSCQRSVKFRKKPRVPVFKKKKVSEPAPPQEADILIEVKPVLQVTQFTQIEKDFGNRYRNQRFTQTQTNAIDAYTQSERKQANASTTMSHDRLNVTVQDREVQTSSRPVNKRPYTSNRLKKKNQKTYNMISTQAEEPELCNGRRFIIFSREEYDSFLGSRHPDASSLFFNENQRSISASNAAGQQRYR